MSRYHQASSEIDKMKTDEILFYINLIQAEDQYIKQQQDKLKVKQ